MNRPILRRVLLAVGGVLLAVAALLRLAGCRVWLALEIAIPGLVLIGALLVERWRYKPLENERPGPDWIDSGERFLDPETGRLVTVFHNPATGERRYIGR